MTERSRSTFLALLALPLVFQFFALVVTGTRDVPRGVTRPIVVLAIVLATVEILRIVEALVRRYGTPDPSALPGEEASGPDIWETVGNGFISLGAAGIAIYVLTCAACVVGFALSISVQTAGDAAQNMLFSQSEATLVAALSMAALMLEVRIAFIRHFGWPID